MRLVDADFLKKNIPPEEINARIALATAPTIEAEPVKHGRWTKIVHSNNHTTYYCSECGGIFNKGCADLGDYNYCPNCGCKVVGD